MDVGLSRDGCIPRWDVGEPRGEEVIWPDESGWKKTNKKKQKKGVNSRFCQHDVVFDLLLF